MRVVALDSVGKTLSKMTKKHKGKIKLRQMYLIKLNDDHNKTIDYLK